jgi:hypothetical protein
MNANMRPQASRIDPSDWHVDLSGHRFGYVTNFRYDLGFDVSFRADGDSDWIFGARYWHAELMHEPATGKCPEAAILHRLRREAVHVFLRKLRLVERRLLALRRAPQRHPEPAPQQDVAPRAPPSAHQYISPSTNRQKDSTL